LRPTAQQFAHLGHQLLRRRPADGLPGHQDGVESLKRSNLSPRRSQDAPGAIPFDGSAHSARGDRCESPGPGRQKQYHPTSVEALALFEHSPDLAGTHDGR